MIRESQRVRRYGMAWDAGLPTALYVQYSLPSLSVYLCSATFLAFTDVSSGPLQSSCQSMCTDTTRLPRQSIP